MKKITKNAITLCLVAVMGIGMSGCGGSSGAAGKGIRDDIVSTKDSGDGNTLSGSGTEARATEGSAETENASVEQNTSSELFREDENGEWWFDTSQFDASKFDGKLYLDEIEVTLPVTVSDLYEYGIFCDGWTDMTIEAAEQKYETETLNNGDTENGSDLFKSVDGVLKPVENVNQITLYNLNSDGDEYADRSLKESKIGTLMMHGASANEAERMLAGLNLEGRENDAGQYYLDVELLIEAYGPPCYYVNGSDCFLYYYYGDYSMKYMEQGGRIILASYIGTEYFEAEELRHGGISDSDRKYIEAYSKLK